MAKFTLNHFVLDCSVPSKQRNKDSMYIKRKQTKKLVDSFIKIKTLGGVIRSLLSGSS